MQLPTALQPCVSLPLTNHVLVVSPARPERAACRRRAKGLETRQACAAPLQQNATQCSSAQATPCCLLHPGALPGGQAIGRRVGRPGQLSPGQQLHSAFLYRPEGTHCSSSRLHDCWVCVLRLWLPCGSNPAHCCTPPCLLAAPCPAPPLGQAVPKGVRRGAFIFAVIDAPGKQTKVRFSQASLWCSQRRQRGQPFAYLPGSSGLLEPFFSISVCFSISVRGAPPRRTRGTPGWRCRWPTCSSWTCAACAAWRTMCASSAKRRAGTSGTARRSERWGLGGRARHAWELGRCMAAPCFGPPAAATCVRAATSLPLLAHAASRFAQGLTCEHVPLRRGDRRLVGALWELYKMCVKGWGARVGRRGTACGRWSVQQQQPSARSRRGAGPACRQPCPLPCILAPQDRRAQRVHGADAGRVPRLPPDHPRPQRDAVTGEGWLVLGWWWQWRDHLLAPANMCLLAGDTGWASRRSSTVVPQPAPAPPSPQDKATGALVTFCTGVRSGDTLMPMWCVGRAAALPRREPRASAEAPWADEGAAARCTAFPGAAPTTAARRAAPAPPTSTCCTRRVLGPGCAEPAQLEL